MGKVVHPLFRSKNLLLALFLFLGLLGGCQYWGGSFESAAALDQSGKSAQAIQAYLQYLNHHPDSVLAARIHYRIAKNYEAQSDYYNAIEWYGKILKDFPHSDEELHALLDLAALYQDQLKEPSKAVDYDQRAFSRYMDYAQIRDAIQTLVEFQYQTATALFTQKDFKGTDETLTNVYKTFPLVFIPSDGRAKIESLDDRARRALEIAKASVDWIVLKNELPFNKSYEGDFEAPDKAEQTLASPDGNYLAERKKASNGNYYMFYAKVTPNSDTAKFIPLLQSFGAESPAWAPDSQSLVYWQTVGKIRKLQKTDVPTKSTRTLFYTRSVNLGIHPAYHPAGNKIAYIYAGKVCLVSIGEQGYKQLLKTKQNLDYTAELSWSFDGTMIRCRQAEKHRKILDELLVLDVSAPNNP
jgi:tetratricopeptide (TPR) repeat protein